MSVLAQLLGTYEAGHTITQEGRDFTFGRIDQRVKAALGTAYFKRAREGVYILRGEIGDEEFDRQLSHITTAYRRGDYAFPRGETRGYYLGEGLAELTAILTGQPLAECEALVGDRTIEVFHICLCVMCESFPQEKKLMLQVPDTPELLALMGLLRPTLNGSTGSKSTARQPSPRQEFTRPPSPD